MDKKINVMVCDHIKEHRESVSDILQKYEAQRLNAALDIYECSSADEMHDKIADDYGFIDILFLDVDIDGIDVAQVVRKLQRRYRHMIIMLMSVSVDCEEIGYELGIFRFVRKLPDEEKVFRYMDQALIKMRWYDWTIKVVDIKRGAILLSQEEIIYVTIRDRRLEIFTESYGMLRVKGQIDAWKKKIVDTHFFSPHKSYVLNLAKVHDIRNGFIYMSNGDAIRLSKNKLREFVKYYELYQWDDL